MNPRIVKARKLLSTFNLDALLITKPENRRYLSGFTGSAGSLLITKDRLLILSDFRYKEQCAEQSPDYCFTLTSDTRPLGQHLAESDCKRIGFEAQHVTYDFYQQLSKHMSLEQLVPTEGLIETLREIKDAAEIASTRKAASIADSAFAMILPFLKPGISEREIALRLENFMKSNGAEDLAFKPIIASGRRSALPHGIYSDKLIEHGDFVTMDFGCKVDGYCSDMTRTVIVGEATPRQQEIYQVVYEAQLKADAAIKPGVSANAIDSLARDHIAQAGYGECFGHGLGHGTGLEIHEYPRFAQVSQRVLEPGMIMTNEPGIYIPGFGGVRIEDQILITDEGREILSASPKTLLIV